MVDKKEITLSNGERITVDVLEYQSRKKDQPGFCIMGIDFDTYGLNWNVEGNIEITALGKLTEQRKFDPNFLLHLMLKYDWNFKLYPNPEVLMLAEKTKIVLTSDAPKQLPEKLPN